MHRNQIVDVGSSELGVKLLNELSLVLNHLSKVILVSLKNVLKNSLLPKIFNLVHCLDLISFVFSQDIIVKRCEYLLLIHLLGHPELVFRLVDCRLLLRNP